jgi:hypothetical protein
LVIGYRRDRLDNLMIQFEYIAARASRNQSIISETGKLRTGKFFGKSLLRSHEKSSREGTMSSDTDITIASAEGNRALPRNRPTDSGRTTERIAIAEGSGVQSAKIPIRRNLSGLEQVFWDWLVLLKVIPCGVKAA